MAAAKKRKDSKKRPARARRPAKRKPPQRPVPPPCGPFVLPLSPDPPHAPVSKIQAWRAHGRIAQALFSLGVGAGPIRITEAAALTFYRWFWKGTFEQSSEEHYRAWNALGDAATEGFLNGPEDFQNHAAQVLDMARTVGRVAAHFASCQGRFAIDSKDIDDAMETVRKSYGFQKRKGGRGNYCIPDPWPRKRS